MGYFLVKTLWNNKNIPPSTLNDADSELTKILELYEGQ